MNQWIQRLPLACQVFISAIYSSCQCKFGAICRLNFEEDYELHIFHGASSLLIVYSVLGCSSLWRKFSGAKQGLRRLRVKRRHLVRLLEEVVALVVLVQHLGSVLGFCCGTF